MKKMKITGKAGYVLSVAIASVIGGLVSTVVLAAIPAANGTISGCYSNKGALTVIDAESGQTCKNNETALNWNQTGPQGPAGSGGGAVAYAHFEMSLASNGNGWEYTSVDPNFPSSNVTVLGQSSGNTAFYDCLKVGGSPKGVMASQQGTDQSGFSYGVAGDSEFSALNESASCPTDTNVILANAFGGNPYPLFLTAY
jgi:hypothetical protein